MDQPERIAVADATWAECQKILPPSISSLLVVMGGNAEAFDMHSKGSARLRIQPKNKKTPAGFWKGRRWYEILVGAIPGRTLTGEIAFIFGSAEKAGLPAPYARAVAEIFRACVSKLGGNFTIHPPSVTALASSYKGRFPIAQAAADLARLIEFTLPRFLALPEERTS